MTDYFVKSGTGGADTGADWANAAESIPGLMAAQAIAVGDTIYVHNTHNYAPAAAITWTLPEATGTGLVRVLCVDGGDASGTSLSGTTVGNLTTGAIENTAGNAAFVINVTGGISSTLYVHGLTIKTGSNASQTLADMTINGLGRFIASDCLFHLDSTSGGAVFAMGGANTQLRAQFVNCRFSHGTAGAVIQHGNGEFEFIGCSIDASSATPMTSLLGFFSGADCTVLTCSGCNWSGATNVLSYANLTASGKVLMSNCAINTPATGTHPGAAGLTVEMHACDAVGGSEPKANILAYYYEDASGVVEDDLSVCLTTGGAAGEQSDASDDTYSLKMTPTAACTQATPLYTPWIYKLVGTTGDKTVTMKVADTETDADELHTSQLWMEVQYMGEPGATGTQRVADSPMSIMEVDDDCPVVSGTIYRDVSAAGADRTDTDEAWSNLTETNTYTLTASINCAEVGYIRCRVGLGIDTTNPVYVDPKISVT